MTDLIPIKLLYVEDEPDLRDRITIVLEMHFKQVFQAANGMEGLELFSIERPDIVISDIMMPVMDGLEMAKGISELSPETPVIFTTAFTETAYLLKAIELGIAAYVRKPLDCRHLIEVINRAATPILQRIELETSRKAEQASLEHALGENPVMQEVISKARMIADTGYSVMLQGETGVGKSHLASLIHSLSRRRHQPFISVSLSSLPETLVESQLFGHMKGAFTGAVSEKKGLLKEADGGTVFLDDVDCAPPAIQAKILHAVEKKWFFPLGGNKPIEADFRVISASNRDLLDEVKKGSFREDLYYRLADLVITLPPLRQRGSDITSLARLFLNDASLELDRIPPILTPEAVLLLTRSPWPGNLRELKSAMKRIALFAGEIITGEDLAIHITGITDSGFQYNSGPLHTLEELVRMAVIQALSATGGKKMEAARLLNVEYGRFKRMLEKYQA